MEVLTSFDVEAEMEFQKMGEGGQVLSIFTCPLDLLPCKPEYLIETEINVNGSDKSVVEKYQLFKRNGREMVAMLVSYNSW